MTAIIDRGGAARSAPGSADCSAMPVRRPLRRLRALALAGLAALSPALVAPDAAFAAGAEDRFIHPGKAIAAPSGFVSVCDRYDWACAAGSTATAREEDFLKIAASVNRTVNAGVRQITDERQYGRDDVWALPTASGGDCEDFALLKKRALIERGIPASRLLIATVLDGSRAPHAVLVLRTGSGDLVLDNLRSRIRPWNETGYSFLRLQNPDSPASWRAVLAGGIFRNI
jgi:predicted transglutaminase-like cysteine proteinase